MTFSDAEIQENAFVKGIREITERDRMEAARVRKEIRAALGGIQRAQYYVRQNGFTKHTPVERQGIERIFRKHKIAEPWGL